MHDLPSLHGGYEVTEICKRRALSPETQSHHIGHVLGLRGTRCGGINHTRLGQLLLQLQHSLARLCRFARTHWTQILCLVALIEDDQSLEILTTPLQQLTEARTIFARLIIGFANQRRVGAEDYTTFAIVVRIRTDFGVLELQPKKNNRDCN